MVKGMPLANSLGDISAIRNQILNDEMAEFGIDAAELMDVRSYVSDDAEDVVGSEGDLGSEMDYLFYVPACIPGTTSDGEDKENQQVSSANVSQSPK